MKFFTKFDSVVGMYASLLNGQINCSITSTTESIHKRTNMREGMVLTWIASGSGKLKIAKKTYEIHDNCICFRHPRIDYELILYDHTQYRRCFLVIPDELFFLIEKFFPQNMNAEPIIYLDNNDDSIFYQYLDLINDMKTISDNNIYELFPHIFKLVLNLLPPEINKNGKNYELLHCAHNMLRSDFITPLPKILEKLNMSYNAFRKKFTSAYGISPSKYRNRCRVEAAQQLLSMGLSCDDVSEKLSYPDVYTFSHQFKALVGIPPKKYQKSHIL